MAIKPVDPMKIMNSLAGAAHKRVQPKLPSDEDEDDMAIPSGKKNSKQAAAISEKNKGNAKAPKFSKSS